MSDKTIDVVTRFVDLALKYKQWKEITMLPVDEMWFFFDTVSAAGFNPKELMPGRLVGHYRDQDGSSTGETYPINGLCPFKVISQEDSDHYFATGWLDCALRRVVYGYESREKLIEMMAEEIERSIPLEPIQLTPEGDFLREYPPSPKSGLAYFVKHTKDEDDLSSCVGVHMHCDGWMDRIQVTTTKNAIVCRRCHLRVLFPIMEVKTYGDLRQFLSQSA